ncbi:hypothetical protein HOD30_00055 [Candidatus Peregrinibacteria bacterium]|jgi:hypothetical protein|nr:hypothetical protein [Candidatus Peregrinibacteria bacterium]MBT4632394.1 hypothetical protein [Candidatus Peregrinibacteria bacterium]MBT5517045.1 hypothetical protein [Candidatus Peregrinibacteria bacterium]MBT5823598.1 hypothetical protein [Candidatus Peregrinibacteria bacterium]
MENKLKHLEFIQGIISRMAANSFYLKGWSLTVFSGLLALSVDQGEVALLLVAVSSSVLFWLLDGYYLWQERLFRHLYDSVRLLEETQIDFAMKIDSSKEKYLCVLTSKTIFLFYFGMLSAAALTYFLTK